MTFVIFSEVLYEDQAFKNRELAALVASRVSISILQISSDIDACNGLTTGTIQGMRTGSMRTSSRIDKIENFMKSICTKIVLNTSLASLTLELGHEVGLRKNVG